MLKAENSYLKFIFLQIYIAVFKNIKILCKKRNLNDLGRMGKIA